MEVVGFALRAKRCPIVAASTDGVGHNVARVDGVPDNSGGE